MSGSPRIHAVSGIENVISSAMASSAIPARYFPITSSHSEAGKESVSSNTPTLLSSDHIGIASAGTISRNR